MILFVSFVEFNIFVGPLGVVKALHKKQLIYLKQYLKRNKQVQQNFDDIGYIYLFFDKKS